MGIGSGFYFLVSGSGFIMKFQIRIRAGQNHGPPQKEKREEKKSCLKSSLEG
jgi:hypothetical protein